MKHLMKLWILSLTLMVFGLQVAEAKRFGGGKSFGFSKKVAPKQFKNTPPVATKPAAPAAGSAAAGAGAKASGASRFLGPLAGLAAGGLLAAMLFGDGFEGMQMMDILLIVLVVGGIWFFLRRRRAAAATPAFASPGHQPLEPMQQRETAPERASTQQRAAAPEPAAYDPHAGGSLIGSGVSDEANSLLVAPAWFDETSFMDGAKGHFVAVQKAWDALDVSEIQSYCTPELFTALQAEMDGMEAGTNHTEVDELNAELATMAIDGDYFVVSVRFSGFIKESKDADAHAFNEIWHIRRLAAGEGNWLIAGIQQ